MIQKQRKKPKQELQASEQNLNSNQKYLNKIILAQSPYLDKGKVITKKYLNPFYVDPNPNNSILLPKLKSPYAGDRTKSSEQQPRSPYERSIDMPSLYQKKHASPDRNKYSFVKPRYLTNSIGSSLFGSSSAKPGKINYYYFDCGLFNNGSMVRRNITNRSWWKDRNMFKSFQPPLNFIWTGGTSGFSYDSLTAENETDPTTFKCINRFQNGFEINDKDNLFRNLWHHHEADRKAILEYVPVTFSFRVEELMFGKSLQEFARFFLSLKKGVPIEEIKPVGKEKDAEGNEYDVFFFFGHEFQPGNQSSNYQNFKSHEIKKDHNLFNGHNLWMLKPSGFNRGRGLELFTELKELDSYLKMFSKGYDITEFANMDYNDQDEVSPAIKALMNKDKARKQPLVYKNTDFNTRITHFVIQKYIERPMLYKYHKFDLRVFALMTHERELLVFGDCYVRLSSLPYDPDKKNYLIHLTNNAVQVRSNSYGSLVKGNIISIRELEEYSQYLFKETGNQIYDIEAGHFMRKIKEVIKTTFDSTESILSEKERKFNFELFGYDFMIDADMKLWLIEVNSIPSLGESNTYITKLMNRMIDDMFKLTIDKIFPPPYFATESNDRHQDFYPFPNDKNLWESVCKYPLA